MHKPQPHNMKNLVRRVTMPFHGVVIVVSYEQPAGMNLAYDVAQVDATPPPSVR